MTKNKYTSQKQTILSEPSPMKLVLLISIVITVCLLVSSAFIYLFTQQQAQQYRDNQLAVTMKQAERTLQPMILANNTVNMNFYLNTLVQTDFLNGLILVDEKGKLLARAGHGAGTISKKVLFKQQLAIGEITFFISQHPATAFFKKLLILFLIAALGTALITLIFTAIFAKKILRDFTSQYTPLLQHQFSMELAKADSTTSPQPQPVDLAIVDIKAPAINSEPTSQPDQLDEPAEEQQETLTNEDISHRETPAPIGSESMSQESHKEQSEELISLLKPDNTQRMPHFSPSSNKPDDGIELQQNSTQPEIELTESTTFIDEQTTQKQNNPLMRTKPHEEQLDLYSLEHQLELSLKAEDAAYLLFIDCNSGRASIEDHEEHNALLTQYRRLIKQVINIYGGSVELLANGDLRVLFDEQDLHDNHGVQALCAAKLFNQLYKYYNQRQITRMQPTLNIQSSLVRGNRTKLELLREESHFLTCTTVTNELISHTQLSEVQALKESLLDEAVTERQDEDKILIITLNPTYQSLLEKQARHLVKGL